MKKMISVLLAAVFALTFTMSVSADVIFEPDDDFYSEHSSECTRVERIFVATEDVSSYLEPNNSKVLCTFTEGDELTISYTYEDKNGIVWGQVSFSAALGSDTKGWVPMGNLAVVYDNASFLSEFADEITEDTDDLKLPSTDMLIFWNYPGSGDYYDIELWDDSSKNISFTYSYTDPNGITWGYVPYLYGMSGWVRIDDPSNTTAPEILEREPEILHPTSVIDPDEIKEPGLSPIWLAVILVGAACVVTVILLITLTSKKKA